MTPQGNYILWKKTATRGELPGKDNWFRLIDQSKDNCVERLSIPEEKFAKEHALGLKESPFHQMNESEYTKARKGYQKWSKQVDRVSALR